MIFGELGSANSCSFKLPLFHISEYIKPQVRIGFPLLYFSVSLPSNTKNDYFPGGNYHHDLAKATCASWKCSRISFFMMEKYFIELRARLIGRQVAWERMEIYYKHIYQPGPSRKQKMAQVVQQKIVSWRDSLQGQGTNERGQGTQRLQRWATLGRKRNGGPGRSGVRRRPLWQEAQPIRISLPDPGPRAGREQRDCPVPALQWAQVPPIGQILTSQLRGTSRSSGSTGKSGEGKERTWEPSGE